MWLETRPSAVGRPIVFIRDSLPAGIIFWISYIFWMCRFCCVFKCILHCIFACNPKAYRSMCAATAGQSPTDFPFVSAAFSYTGPKRCFGEIRGENSTLKCDTLTLPFFLHHLKSIVRYRVAWSEIGNLYECRSMPQRNKEKEAIIMAADTCNAKILKK